MLVKDQVTVGYSVIFDADNLIELFSDRLLVKCPHCDATYQTSRAWDRPLRCECGQLFWRAVKVEISEKLKSAEEVEHFFDKINEFGWVRKDFLRSEGTHIYKLTQSAMLVLKDPVSFYAVIDNTEQVNDFVGRLKHDHICEPLYAHAKLLEDQLPQLVADQKTDLQRRAILEICAAYDQIIDSYREELTAFKALCRIAALRGGSLPEPFPTEGHTRHIAYRYEEKLKKEPKDPDACVIVYQALTLTAETYEYRKKDRGKWLEKALQLDASNSSALLERARAQKRRKAQLADVEHAIQSDPSNADAWAFKGQILAETKGTGESEFKKSLELDPTHIQARIFVEAGQWLADAVSAKKWWRIW